MRTPDKPGRGVGVKTGLLGSDPIVPTPTRPCQTPFGKEFIRRYRPFEVLEAQAGEHHIDIDVEAEERAIADAADRFEKRLGRLDRLRAELAARLKPTTER